jgi:hypothetical protein
MKKRCLALLYIVLLIASAIYSINILTKKIWSVAGDSAFELARQSWMEGQRQKAVAWWLYGFDRTIRDTINRERAYKILQESIDLLDQGKTIDALNSCYLAARIYDEEGEITYRCMLFEQKIDGMPIPSSTHFRTGW